MTIEKLNTVTLKDKRTKNKNIRVYPSGSITISDGIVEDKKLEEGGAIEVFRKKEEHREIYFISKSNNEKGYRLGAVKGGLKLTNVALAKRLIAFFGIEEEEKSLTLLVKPEPHRFKKFQGYIAYELVKKP